jgi:hypothetical protein
MLRISRGKAAHNASAKGLHHILDNAMISASHRLAKSVVSEIERNIDWPSRARHLVSGFEQLGLEALLVGSNGLNIRFELLALSVYLSSGLANTVAGSAVDQLPLKYWISTLSVEAGDVVVT